MINKIKINGKITYLILVGIILVLASLMVYAVPSEIGHSINEIDWSGEVAHLQVQNLNVGDTIEIVDVPLSFSAGLTSNEISADEDLFAETFFIASQVRAHELYLGSDYATAPFISDWENLSSANAYDLWMSYEADPIEIDWNGNNFDWQTGVEYSSGYVIDPNCDAGYAGNKKYKVIGALPNAEWKSQLCSWNGVGYTWSGSWTKVNAGLTYDVYIHKYYTYPQGVGSGDLDIHTTRLLLRASDGGCYACGPDNSDNWVCEVALHSSCA